MQQFFADVPLSCGMDYVFTKEQAHHARDVVRLSEEKVRLVYQGKAYFATAGFHDGVYSAHVETEDPRYNELPSDLILAMALIRREKMELVLQKAAELGAKEIVPFVSSRCVVKDDAKKKERREGILREASAQCKRNIIPLLADTMRFDDLGTIQADTKLAAYENAWGSQKMLRDVHLGKRIVIAIGPEGGFSEDEVRKLAEMGYEAVTLGSRILRAETAAMYACSVIGELTEVSQK